MIDVILLTFFMIELTVRLYAFGFKYLKDWLNGIDALVVTVSFAFLWLNPVIVGDQGLGDAAGVSGITRLVRLVSAAYLPALAKPARAAPARRGHSRARSRLRRCASSGCSP